MATLLTLDGRLALLVHAIAATAVIGAILGLAWVLRDKDPNRNRFGIYESGAPVSGAPTSPVPALYFQIAAFFVVFDFEAAVLYTWAVTAREAAWTGLLAATVFIGVLLAALAYLWADGALDTGPRDARGRQ